jgi:tetratricopeptide (TPR) repeat protein
LTPADLFAEAVRKHQAGSLPEAERLCRQILQVNPTYPQAYYLLGVLALQVGKPAQAVPHLEQALGLKMHLGPVYYYLGIAYQALGQLEPAAGTLQEALRLQPDLVAAHLALSEIRRKQNRFPQAEASLREVLRLKPQDAEAHNLLGNLLFARGKVQEAAEYYREATRLQPGHAEAHNNLGVMLAEQKLPNEAAKCYREALGLRPDFPVAHNNLGNALRALGQPADAIPCFQRALRLVPAYPEAHNNLGVALADLGRQEEAIVCYREALRLKPDYAQAHNNLGNALRDLGKGEEAVPCFREAIRLWPGYTEAHNNLGVALRDLGQFPEAVACYREAIRLQPDYADAHNNLADVLLDHGELAEALAQSQEALRLQPDHAQALYCLGQLAAQGLVEFPEGQLERVRTLLTAPGLKPTDASLLHFALANVLNYQAHYDEAFAHYEQANALRRRVLQQSGKSFDRREHDRRFHLLLEFFTPEFFQRSRSLGLATEVPVFIVGMPRSGTSLVEQILSHHPAAFGAGELKEMGDLVVALPRLLRSAKGYPECLEDLDKDTARRLAAEYLQGLERLGGTTPRVTDKMPDNFRHLGLIATLFPQARIIHCRREALDVCLSCFFQNFRVLYYTWDLEDLAFYYRRYEQLMAHWRAVLPLRICEVAYEDLVADQEGVSRRFVEFCGLEWDDRCLAFEENRRPVQTASKLQVRRPVYASSVGRWRRYAAHLEPLRQALGLAGAASVPQA